MTRVDQLRELVHQHAYRESTVADWSDERIATVLESRRRESRLGLARASGVAEQIDGARGTASRLERQVAAVSLEEALADGTTDALVSVLYVGWCLTRDELREVATGLIQTLRGE